MRGESNIEKYSMNIGTDAKIFVKTFDYTYISGKKARFMEYKIKVGKKVVENSEIRIGANNEQI